MRERAELRYGNILALVFILLLFPMGITPSIAALRNHSVSQTSNVLYHGINSTRGVTRQSDVAAMLQPRQTTALAGAVNYDEQIGETFTQSFTSMAYNVTAMAQVDSDGYGPAYLLNGLSDVGYWYQVGLAYDWDGTASGFVLAYEVFNSTGGSIFPTNGGGGVASFSGAVNQGDTVLLNLYFGTGSYAGEVVMYAYDWNTNAYAYETYSTESASNFVGNANSISNANGFFTGLMTEQYHSAPYYGNEQFVSYSDQYFALSSAWLWIDEWNVVTNQSVSSAQSSSPVAFDNLHQLHQFASNGATEYADSYVLDTGGDSVSMSLSASPILVDVGMQAQATLAASASGGTAPYTYLVFLNNNLFSSYSSSSGIYNTTLNFDSLGAGSHDYYVDVVDSNGYPASSQSIGFTVNADPSLIISAPIQQDQGQTLTVNYQPSGGTLPYKETLYMNGTPVGQTNTVKLNDTGQYQISAQLADAAGYTTSSNVIAVDVNPDPTTSIAVSKTSLDSNQEDTFSASAQGGSSPYTFLWYVNGQQVERQTSSASSSYTDNATAAGNYVVYFKLVDSANYETNSTQETITVNRDPALLNWSVSGESTSFFFSNNAAKSSVAVSGGTAPYTYTWYLNGVKISQGNSPDYTYSLSQMGQNKLQLNVSDSAGFVVASQAYAVNYSYNVLNIG
ncbi:MAG: hypothetical protein ACRECH_09460, partial [Nitrososphaerales archaeon]